MKLKEYLDYYGIKKQFFADKVGISITTLDKILKGNCHPHKLTLESIERVTEGKVKVDEI